ncbi:glycosyltransferase family A protein [Lactiplantibacillus plantarum]|uniref:glycosyltransferase family A protein n=1 Tax=Lactiplantibacillus plantarum TaxID=1590 RepID=UPI003B66ED07
MELVTIITPTYNRSTTLERCWQSLQKQNNKNFQWLVIDDGSTDETQELMAVLKKQTIDFEISYQIKPNGGKHTALNFAHPYIKGEVVLILDSDDFLTTDAINTVLQEWKKIEDKPEIGGITFMKSSDGITALAKMPEESILSDHIHFRINQHINGDCCETLRASIFKEYVFPEIAGEVFLSEGMLWTTTSLSYRTLYLDKIVYIAPEYRSDGLSQAGRKMRLKNLQGALLNCELHMNKKIIFSFRLKKAILKICYSFFLHKRIKEIINTTQYKILIIISIPAGYLLYLYWHKKYGVDEKC